MIKISLGEYQKSNHEKRSKVPAPADITVHETYAQSVKANASKGKITQIKSDINIQEYRCKKSASKRETLQTVIDRLPTLEGMTDQIENEVLPSAV